MSEYKNLSINEGLSCKKFNLRAYPNRLLSYRKMRLLLYRMDSRGRRVPFRIRFVSQKGELIDWQNVVCTSRNEKKRTHTFISIESHNYRTVKDILIMMIDDIKITVD